jgi:hypothetical protein
MEIALGGALGYWHVTFFKSAFSRIMKIRVCVVTDTYSWLCKSSTCARFIW